MACNTKSCIGVLNMISIETCCSHFFSFLSTYSTRSFRKNIHNMCWLLASIMYDNVADANQPPNFLRHWNRSLVGFLQWAAGRGTGMTTWGQTGNRTQERSPSSTISQTLVAVKPDQGDKKLSFCQTVTNGTDQA